MFLPVCCLLSFAGRCGVFPRHPSPMAPKVSQIHLRWQPSNLYSYSQLQGGLTPLCWSVEFHLMHQEASENFHWIGQAHWYQIRRRWDRGAQGHHLNNATPAISIWEVDGRKIQQREAVCKEFKFQVEGLFCKTDRNLQSFKQKRMSISCGLFEKKRKEKKTAQKTNKLT